jgi:hypothetical protein
VLKRREPRSTTRRFRRIPRTPISGRGNNCSLADREESVSNSAARVGLSGVRKGPATCRPTRRPPTVKTQDETLRT